MVSTLLWFVLGVSPSSPCCVCVVCREPVYVAFGTTSPFISVISDCHEAIQYLDVTVNKYHNQNLKRWSQGEACLCGLLWYGIRPQGVYVALLTLARVRVTCRDVDVLLPCDDARNSPTVQPIICWMTVRRPLVLG